jgi:hypothetical protein
MTSELEQNIEKNEALHCEEIKVPGKENEEIVYTDHDFHRVGRKLDFWLMSVLMISYGLQ